jgi:hypothetical protein
MSEEILPPSPSNEEDINAQKAELKRWAAEQWEESRSSPKLSESGYVKPLNYSREEIMESLARSRLAHVNDPPEEFDEGCLYYSDF